MSWFLGGVGIFQKEYLRKIQNFIPASLLNYSSDDFFLFAGGNPAALKFKLAEDPSRFNWLQAGIGISRDHRRKFLTENDWAQLSASGNFDNLKIDGHWIFINWDREKIEFSTDRLGLRDFYYCVNHGGNIFFSTRIDWLAKFTETQIDFKNFGSRWKLFNQISSESILKNIERVSGGAFLSVGFREKNITLKKNPLDIFYCNDKNTGFDFNSRFEELISFPLDGNKLSLSFSGGLDSRVILSSLLKNKKNDWDTHTFGNSENLDLAIAQKICSDLSVPNQTIDLDFPQSDQFLSELKEYSAISAVNNSASSFLQLRNYAGLKNDGRIIIDGGFGEIWRREFFNRLLFLGSKYIINRESEKLAPYLRLHRADIFSREINGLMNEGIADQMEEIMALLPDPVEIGKENWIDLFAVNTRIKNYYSHEQTRLDQINFSYMPFLQSALIENLLVIPVKDRKNGKLFKSFILKNEPRLACYPLVKGESLQPFGRSTFASRIVNSFRKKTDRDSGTGSIKNDFIISLAPCINDMVCSREVKECGLYDMNKLTVLSSGLVSENNFQKSVDELDWWLSFELFRAEISEKFF